MNFDEAEKYLHALTRLGIKLGNERFEELLSRLGNPHLGLRTIHVAGTKGKGSTAMFAAAILGAARYKVGLYLSPNVYDLCERVQVNGKLIPHDDLARLASRIRPVAERIASERPDLGPTTEFEFKTAIGFCHFAEQQVDYAVIEVGLGGRLDATNVLVDPLVSIITNIGFDHVHILGDTLEKIAGEKAGIIKPGGNCVTGAQAPDALATIQSVSRLRGARFAHIRPDIDWSIRDNGALSVRTPRRVLGDLELGVRGDFQFANAALAVSALDRVNGEMEISDDAVRRGLALASMPGRLEIVRDHSPTVIVDAAHNEMAAEALSASVRREFHADRRPVVLVVGMSKGHDPVEFLRSLIAGFDPLDITVIATEPPFRPRDAADIAMAARDVGMRRVECVTPVPDAAERAVSAALKLGQHAIVLVTGSFYTIGELGPERWIEIFDRQGLNTRMPADILDTEDQVRI